jgi:hypothetical protein
MEVHRNQASEDPREDPCRDPHFYCNGKFLFCSLLNEVQTEILINFLVDF